jgi:hypothetical protein
LRLSLLGVTVLSGYTDAVSHEKKKESDIFYNISQIGLGLNSRAMFSGAKLGKFGRCFYCYPKKTIEN